MRRRAARLRRRPDWGRLDPSTFATFSPPERENASSRARAVAAMVLLVLGGGWLFAFAPASSAVLDTRAPAPPNATEVTLPDPTPPPEEVVPEELPTEEAPDPETPPALVPSVGLVSAGPSGGAGNGAPGLDLGLEAGAGAGMAVVAGGGGSGGGVGTGTGNGVGTARFVYQPGQTDQDAAPSGALSAPNYPRRAKEDGIEANVELRLLVDERGRVEQVEVLGAPPGYGFEAALRQTAEKWRFQPAMLGGVPVPQWVRMPWRFRLDG